MIESARSLGRPIYNLQTMLRVLSQTDSRILPVIPDGIYGANTYASVRSFQEMNALPATGYVNLSTWNKIISEYNDAFRSISATMRLQIIQAMLTIIAEHYPMFKAPSITGIYNEETESGLRFIQAAANLPQTGNLTIETQKALLALYRSLI